MGTQLEVKSPNAIAGLSDQFHLKFGRIGARGYEYNAGVEISPEEMLEEAERLKGGFTLYEKWKPYVIISFVRQSHLRVGEAASQVYDMFDGLLPSSLKGMLAVYDHVPPELWNPDLPFEIVKRVAYVGGLPKTEEEKAEKTEHQRALLNMAVEKKLTVQQFDVAKPVYCEKMGIEVSATAGQAATPSQAGAGTPTATSAVVKVPPFHFPYTFRAPEPKEKIADWTTAMLADNKVNLAEAAKRYTQPKYAEQQKAKERESKFRELMKGVPEADQAPFVKDYEEGILPITSIARSVNEYKGKKATADALNTLLNTVVDEAKREEFRTQAESGTDIKVAVNDWNKRAINVKAIETALDEAKITDETGRAKYIAQFDAEPAVKIADIKKAIKKAGKETASAETDKKAVNDALDAAKITEPEPREKFLARLGTDKVSVIKADVKKAGKAAADETKRAADVKALLETIPEDQRDKFLETADVNVSAKDFKAKITAWTSAKASENRGAADERRKAVKQKRADAEAMLKKANKRREDAGTFRAAGQEALAVEEEAQAEKIEAAANKMSEECDQEIIEINLMLGVAAHPKPTKGEGKKVGKKTAKKRAKHSKR